MNSPRITSSDEGITLNKTLAWTILVALVLGGMWVGRVVASVEVRVTSLEAGSTDRRTDQAAIDARLRLLENAAPAINQRLDFIAAGIGEIKQQLERRQP